MNDWRKTVRTDGLLVETFWDRYSRNWITHILDENGYEIETELGHCLCSGYKAAAQLTHKWFMEIETKG